MVKMALMRTATIKENPELPLLQTIMLLATDDNVIRVNCTSDSSPNKMFQRVQVTDTSTSTDQRRPSWSVSCKETTTKGHQ
jgi:hypothetical protein